MSALQHDHTYTQKAQSLDPLLGGTVEDGVGVVTLVLGLVTVAMEDGMGVDCCHGNVCLGYLGRVMWVWPSCYWRQVLMWRLQITMGRAPSSWHAGRAMLTWLLSSWNMTPTRTVAPRQASHLSSRSGRSEGGVREGRGGRGGEGRGGEGREGKGREGKRREEKRRERERERVLYM